MIISIFRNLFCCKQLLRAMLVFVMLFCTSNFVKAQQQEMIIRISEIEIYPEHLEEYNAILKYEAEASVRLEPGVITIFPMYQKENPTQIRILEMYKDQEAYQSHLKTTHFLHYKTSTLKMVKSLKLMDMKSIDEETMVHIFKKLK